MVTLSGHNLSLRVKNQVIWSSKNVADLFRRQIRDIDNVQRLEEYWEKHRLHGGEISSEAGTDSPLSYRASVSNTQLNGRRLSRTVTDATALIGAPQLLASHHPALSLTDMINSFGPLIFRLYRAALLRKRILLVGEAPVHQTCDFGEQSKGSSQLYSLIIHSLRSLCPGFGSKIALTAPACRWYSCLPTTAFVQRWSSGYPSALQKFS